MNQLSHLELAHVLARWTLGINFFLHGLVRLPKLSAFVQGLERKFSESLVPEFFVTPIAYAIPFVEVVLGALILLGIFTREALVGSALLMMGLIAGCCLVEDWGAVGTQMVYAAFIAGLIASLDHLKLAIRG